MRSKRLRYFRSGNSHVFSLDFGIRRSLITISSLEIFVVVFMTTSLIPLWNTQEQFKSSATSNRASKKRIVLTGANQKKRGTSESSLDRLEFRRLQGSDLNCTSVMGDPQGSSSSSSTIWLLFDTENAVHRKIIQEVFSGLSANDLQSLRYDPVQQLQSSATLALSIGVLKMVESQ